MKIFKTQPSQAAYLVHYRGFLDQDANWKKSIQEHAKWPTTCLETYK